MNRPLVIVVAVPTRTLCANGRAHWRAVHAAKKRAKYAAHFAAIAAMNAAGIGRPKWRAATISAKAFWRDRRSQWDDDNFWGAMKAARDGIAEAGVVENDRAFQIGESDICGVDGANPRVELTIVPKISGL